MQEAGDGSGARYALARKAVLGRQPHSEVPLADDNASREHARIEFYPHARQHVLFDLNSRNGTLVNGERLSEPRGLMPHDKIQIGEIVLRYEPGDCVSPGFIPPGRTVVASWAEMAARARRETEAVRRSRKEEEPAPPPASDEPDAEPSRRPAAREPKDGSDSGLWVPGRKADAPPRTEKAPAAPVVHTDRVDNPAALVAASLRATAAARPASAKPTRGPRIFAISLCVALVLASIGIVRVVRPGLAARDPQPVPDPGPTAPIPSAKTDPVTSPRTSETVALACMKALVSVEIARKQAGNDYLVDSVWALCYGKDNRGVQMRLIPEVSAMADFVNLGARAKPYQGYYFSAIRCDENGIPYVNLKDRRFAFCAWPSQYEAGAVRTFIVGESGVVWMKDLPAAGPVRQWPALDPTRDRWAKAD